MNILLVIGGKSVEESISVLTGLTVYRALKSSGKYFPYLVYYDQFKDAFFSGKGVYSLENYDKRKDFKKVTFHKDNKNYFKMGLKKYYFDIVLPLVHGENAEDGTMAAYFNVLGYPTLSSSIQGLSVSQDKILFKRLLNSLKIKTPRFTYLDMKDYHENAFNISKYLKNLKFPLVVKPYNLGSSIGISVVDSIESLYSSLDLAFSYSSRIIIEEYVKEAKEINIALIKGKDGIIFSELEEIVKDKDKIYSYEEKYLKPGVNKIVPKIEDNIKEEIKRISEKVYLELSLSGPVRFDFLIKEDVIYLNEVNPIPGNFAYHLFAQVGISVTELIDIYILESLERIKRNLLPRKEKASFEAFESSNKLKFS